MDFFNVAATNFKTNWSLYLAVLVVVYLFVKLSSKLRGMFFGFISAFTIPGTISFVALVIVLIHFYQNSLKADDIIFKLLALIVINFHLPNILSTLGDAISRMKNLQVGSFEAKFDAIGITADALRQEQNIQRTSEQIYGEKTVGNLTNYMYSLFGALRSKLDSLFKIVFSEENVPVNTYSIVIRLQEAGNIDPQTVVILNTLINLSDLFYLGYKPSSIEINNAIDYCLYSLDYLNKKEVEMTNSNT